MDGVTQLKEEQSKPDSQIDPRFVFIKPPSMMTLEARPRGRGTEDESSIQRRLARARAEIEYAETGVHDKIIVNLDLESAFHELQDFVFNGHLSHVQTSTTRTAISARTITTSAQTL